MYVVGQFYDKSGFLWGTLWGYTTKNAVVLVKGSDETHPDKRLISIFAQTQYRDKHEAVSRVTLENPVSMPCFYDLTPVYPSCYTTKEKKQLLAEYKRKHNQKPPQ